MLWLTGVPGAGKTVLSSFVINRCSEVSCEKPSAPIIFFFFKKTDTDKNSVLAASRSLLYQLYSLYPASLSADILLMRDGSGKDRALSDQRLWDLAVKHARNLANLTIVLDALDECDDVDVLIERLKTLLQCCCAKVFVVSRREENITLALEDYPTIIIGQEDIEADICSYVTAEVGRIPRFRGKSIQQRITRALSSGHGGMFLWAYLMIKELKEVGTVRQVDDALRSLPKGLEKMHEMIITRLDATLHSAHRQLATKILAWIVCAVRPLQLMELQEILRFEIRQGKIAGRRTVDDDDLLYSEKDIELACGALVLSRNGTLQLIHLSTKEILTKRPTQMLPDDSRLAFYVDSQRENPRMATLCISYLSTHLDGCKSLTRPNLEAVSRLQLVKDSCDFTDLVNRSPFIDYASISWQAHLIDGKISLELENSVRRLQALLTYDLTMLWIELCVCLHRDIVWTLERSCKETMSWADNPLTPVEVSCHKAMGFLWAWSNAVWSIIKEYGHVIEEYPYEIHYLDLDNLLRYQCVPGSPVLPASYAATPGQVLREEISEIRAVERGQPSIEVEPSRQLQVNVEDPRRNSHLGFLLYDDTREVYLTAESEISNDTEVLWVQERATGCRLQPVRSSLGMSEVFCQDPESWFPRAAIDLRVMNAVLSPDRTYLAILYGGLAGCFVTSIWIIEPRLDFQNIRDRRPWARRLSLFGTKNVSFLDSCLALTVGLDGLFYCPAGQIHPERGIQKRMPDFLVAERQHILAFAGNGQSIIKLDRKNGLVEEILWLENVVTNSWRLRVPASQGQQGPAYLRAISQTARYMIYESLLEDGPSVVFQLVDREGNRGELRADDPRTHGSTMFYFSSDEQFLLEICKIGPCVP